MARPLDWGDPYPSDINDQPPGSPTANFEEGGTGADYTQISQTPLEPIGSFNPKIDPELPPVLPEREAFVGVVLFEITTIADSPRFYKVLLQSGRVINAKVLNQSSSLIFRGSDPVICARGNSKDEWLMVGHQYWRDLSLVDAYLKIDTRYFIGGNHKLPLSHVHVHNGETVTEKTAIFVLGDVIQIDDPGLYEVTYDITLEEDGSCGCTNFEKSIAVGTGGYLRPWLKLHSSGSNEFWIGASRGSQNQKMGLPPHPPSFFDANSAGHHMYVKKMDGICFEMEWTAPGRNGTVTWYDFYGSLVSLTFEHGICTNGTGLTLANIDTNVQCDDDCEDDGNQVSIAEYGESLLPSG